jgi:hypothetical protein
MSLFKNKHDAIEVLKAVHAFATAQSKQGMWQGGH